MSKMKYIITLKDAITAQQTSNVQAEIAKKGGTVMDNFTIIKAFSAELTESLAQTLENHDLVESIEKDQTVTIQPHD